MIGSDWLQRWARYEPGKIALKEFETSRTLTYRQMENLANFLANRLVRNYGLRKGDRIAVLAENCLEYFLLFFAAQKAGFILVPLNYRLTAREIDFLLSDADPAIVVVSEKFAELLHGSQKSNRIKRLALEELSRDLFEQKDVRHSLDLKREVRAHDPIFILYTSGTTGVPKGALYTHKMLFWNSVNTTMRLDITSEDRSVSCTPLFHTGGWNVIPTPFLHRGAYVCLAKKFEPDTILRLLQEEDATMFMAVPTMLQMMAESPAFTEVRLERMRFFVVGGEPMPLRLIEIWHEKGVPIRQGYGLTEAGPSITSLHQRDAVRKMGSIGTPNFYLETKIVDDKGEPVRPGEVGELLLKGPVVTPGYWHNPEATREAIRDGWFYTGDLVREDDEGYLYVVDRKKNMYISGGENVYPAEVEKFLYSHPGILEVAVIGVPHPRWGEVGKAFIVPRPGHTLTAEEILNFCRGNLARFKIPKYVEFLKALPKSDTGKIDRKTLRKMHEDKGSIETPLN